MASNQYLTTHSLYILFCHFASISTSENDDKTTLSASEDIEDTFDVFIDEHKSGGQGYDDGGRGNDAQGDIGSCKGDEGKRDDGDTRDHDGGRAEGGGLLLRSSHAVFSWHGIPRSRRNCPSSSFEKRPEHLHYSCFKLLSLWKWRGSPCLYRI